MKFNIRRANFRDIDSIVRTEKECFTDPETERNIKDVIENEVYDVFVAEIDGNVAAHIITQTSCGDTDILSVAVGISHRRNGIGGELLKKVVEESGNKDVSNIFLEVRESNLAAIALYEKYGFEKVGERRNFYDNPRENALIMKKNCKGSL